MKVEIDIRDEIPVELAIETVRQVVHGGRVSTGEKGKMYYCWATTFDTSIGDLVVYTRQYRKNDCFVVYKDKSK